MNTVERSMIKIVAKSTPWLAPLPSAFFVGRAAMAHLAVPLPVAGVIAAIVETLGLASVHTWLWLSDWNTTKRKIDPRAPAGVAVVLGGVYLVTTVGLTVVLEVEPSLATYAPALFPMLAIVGAVNLALIGGQEQREAAVKMEAAERKIQRQNRRQADDVRPSRQASSNGIFNADLNALQAARMSKRDARINALLTFLASNPNAGPTEAGNVIGVSRQTVYTYTAELAAAGRLRKNGAGWEVNE